MRLAEKVTDGDAVDWEKEKATHPGLEEKLEHLRLVQSIAGLQSSPEEKLSSRLGADSEPRKVPSDDGVGPSVSGGLEVGSQWVAFYAEYQITVVDLDNFDSDETTIDDLLAGVVFKF